MNGQLPHTEHDHVLTGVKAKPFGWPAASPDPGSGRGPRTASGSPLHTNQQIQLSTVHSKIASGDVFEGDPVAQRVQLLGEASGLASGVHGVGVEVVGAEV